MEQNEKKPITRVMRALHRDIGFFTIGLVIMYALSGIVLIYRDTEFLKSEKTIERKLAINLPIENLSRELHVREIKVTKTDGETLYFENGTYNKATGMAVYTTKDVIFPFNKFNSLHKAGSRGVTHWFTTIFGITLFFLAISSFWMFKSGTRLFKRGIYIAFAGVVFTIVLLFF